MVEAMEKKDHHLTTPTKRNKGGMITMPFIFANEATEKLAVVGFNTNMISYLTTQLHMPLTKAANTLTNFGGTASLTPLLGAFLADSYAGRFWTIVLASVIYQFGMTGLTLSAILPHLRPPPCRPDDVKSPCEEADTGQLAILYISLLLGALGAGGIRPCVVAFGADQFDESDPKQATKTWKYFNWYYFVMGVSILAAVTVVVYIQDNIGWGWGLGIPTLEPVGSPFTRLVQVMVAAWRKRRFFDKAAIVTSDDTKQSPNLWRLNTVHRVEELKSLIRMGPIWAAGILLITAYAQQNTFSLQQAKSMDRHLTTKFQIPAGSMSVFTMTSMLITIVIYDRIFVPLIRRLTGLDRGITFLHRMGIGFVISIMATLVAGFIEVKRKGVARDHGLIEFGHKTVPISVFWLAPQYCLHGIAEAFMSIGHLEFFYDQAPESMRSTAMALFWTAISVGNYTSTLLVTLVHKFSAGSDGSNWLPDQNLNKGKLEYFYWVITGLQVVNFVYYLFCAKLYTYKPIHVDVPKGGCNADEEENGGGIELAAANKV
ncbi:Protein NRT1/ PTR FAMILY 3.1 [Linum perenne]